MANFTAAIATALTPGVALTSAVFYSTSLYNRFATVTGRARELNREARSLQPVDEGKKRRFESVRRQVDVLVRRSVILHRALIWSYGALLGFLMTAIELLAMGLLGVDAFAAIPITTFASALGAMATSIFLATSELRLASTTLGEDVRSSFPEGEGP